MFLNHSFGVHSLQPLVIMLLSNSLKSALSVSGIALPFKYLQTTNDYPLNILQSVK